MASSDYYVSFGYLSKADIQKAIVQGKLGAYSIVFCKDEGIQYLIKDDLTLFEIRSKLRVYASILQAIDYLNADSATYEGEIVAIMDGNQKFKAYIVNKSDSGFYVTDLSTDPSTIDYNALSNVPLINQNGTGDNPIVLSRLEAGKYNITGVFITPDNQTINSPAGDFIIVTEDDDGKFITRIAGKKIYKYTISELINDTQIYITDAYLAEQDYIQNADLDSKIKALNYITHSEMEIYIQNIFNIELIKKIDEEIDNKVQYCSYEDIANLFEKSM